MKTENTLIPMPINEMNKRIGTIVHCNFANPYARWVLREYYTDTKNRVRARLETPRTKKKLEVYASNLMVRPGIMEMAEEVINQQQDLF